jgi:hypothetical protein
LKVSTTVRHLVAARFQNGTVAAPGISFDDETSTGLYKPSAGSIGLAVSGATAAVFGTNFSPTSSADTTGVVNQISFDADYIYVKTSGGWKRATLNTF